MTDELSTNEALARHGLPIASRIRVARELRGLTQSRAVDAMLDSISSAALSQIESGILKPAPTTLDQLADVYDVPVEFFYAHWSGGEADPERLPIYFRDLRNTPARERKRALARTVLLADLLDALEHHVRLPALDIPALPAPADASRRDIEAIAMSVRRAWGLGDSPIAHVVREIERHGIPVARLTMGHTKIDAFSVPFSQRPIVMLTDDKEHHYARSRHDAAHELGHLVMHQGRTERDRSIESQAHSFAASFLIPEGPAREELPDRIDSRAWLQLAEAKRRWGVSLAALLRRCRDLNKIDADEYRNAMKYMSARGWRTQEPGDRELGPAEAPLLIERALRVLEIEHGITAAELIDEAHLPAADTTELIVGAKDRRPVVEF